MTPSGDSDSRVWVNPDTGGVESTAEWQRRLNAGDPEAHRQLAALAASQMTPRRQDPLEVLDALLEAYGTAERYVR